MADRVHRLEENAEQRKVLAPLLTSNFIEHLEGRLDYMERTFTHLNR